jgi:Flp pilus assembly protein TadD
LLLVLTVLGLLAAGTGWYVWQSKDRLEPRAVDLADADPDVAAAVGAAREEVRQAPRSAARWGNLGMVLAANGYYDEADPCFGQAERLEPREARWPYYRGMTLLFRDHEAAIAGFKRAVRLRGDEPAMRLRLAETLLAQDRREEAEEQYRRLLLLEPLNPRAHLGLARLAYLRGDLSAAREALAPCGSDPLTQKASHTLLAEIEQRAGDPAAATRERARAAELPEDQDWADPLVAEIDRLKAGKQARLSYAVQLLRQGRADEAGTLLRELVAAYPDWDQAWLDYGRFLLEGHAYAEADEALRRAVRLAPGSVEGHFYLGVVLVQRGDYAVAGTHFREATRLKPDYARAYYNLGQCLKHQDDRRGAIAAFREAVRCQPNLAAAHTNLGELLARQGDRSEAMEHLRLGLELSPEDANARKLLEQLRKGN